MKAANILILLVLVLGLGTACSGQKGQNTDETVLQKGDPVEVYYFHNARRCATCQAVEAESKAALQEMYGNDVKFLVYSLEDAEGTKKAKELDVSGQTLLVVSGKTKINLTNEGFMYARTNPEKLKQALKKNIDPLF